MLRFRALILSLIILPILCFAKDHVIVFDAGSSGTRAHLYAIEQTDEGVPNLVEVTSHKIKPGISDKSLSDKPWDYSYYLDDLFTALHPHLTDEERANTPIYFYATAGMRTLPKREQVKIMHHVRKHMLNEIKHRRYQPMEAPEENIRVIEGGEEGLFVWIADNYLFERFTTHKVLSADNTVAALEMGGASAEVTYLAHGAKKHVENFVHHDKTYDIYSTAYDGLGINQGAEQMLAAYQKNGGDFAACFPQGASYPVNEPILEGTGDFETCKAFIEDNLYAKPKLWLCQQKYGEDCALLGRYQPKTTAYDYLLTSGFYYTFNILGIADRVVHRPEVENAAQAFCGTPWDELKAAHPEQPDSYLIGYCFNGAWFDTLMDAWHVPQQANLLSTEKNGQALTWPVGAAYYHTVN